MFRVLSVIFFITILFLTACSSKKTEETSTVQTTEQPEHEADVVELTPDQYATAGVQLGTITNTNLSNYTKASGMIDVPPQNKISITSAYGGTVRTLNVIEGKFLKKGQVVATLENPEFLQIQQDYLDGSSQLSFLQQDLTRQEELVKENIAARKSLQRVTSDYNSMTARVEGLKAKLRLLNINPATVRSGQFTSRVNLYAPQDGYVTKIYANIGKLVGSNEVVADMANTQNLLVQVSVFEKDIPKINVGQKIRFTATGDTAERTAEVSLIGKDIHEDRTVDVLGRIISPSQKLLPGMFVNAVLEIGAASTPALPQAAIVQSGDKHYIFVLEEALGQHKPAAKAAAAQDGENKSEEKHYAFRMVEVGTGATENGYTAVVLPENFDLQKKVVLKGAYDLISKMNNSAEEE